MKPLSQNPAAAAPPGRSSEPPPLKVPYVVYAPFHDETSGGSLVLHALADLLRRCGREALLWPPGTQLPRGRAVLAWHLSWLRAAIPRWTRRIAGRATLADRAHEVPLTLLWKLRRAIIVYPEVVSGNPLGSKRVVRWFLNKPGRLTGEIAYGPDELYFYFQQAFDDPALNPRPENVLFILTVMHDVYRQTNFGERKGTCFVLRKGRHRVSDPGLLDGVIVDGKGHAEIARIFNESESCVSYDPYTMYSMYASMCGCKSVVVPEAGVAKEQWQPVEELTWGIAYGEEEIPFAERTRPRMLSFLRQAEAANLQSVARFAEKCERHFLHPPSRGERVPRNP